MICIVRCHKKMPVQLPDGIVKNEGETVACPSACPYKNSSGCSKTTEFKVVFPQQFEDEKGAQRYRPARYSSNELEELWKDTTTVVSAIEPPAASAKSNDHVSEENDSRRITSSSSETAKKYGSFGTSRRTAQDDAVQNTDDALKATNNYDRFEIGGVLFSDDRTVRRDFQARPLKNAVWEVFSYWDTRSVFKLNGELRDDFVWLIVTTSDFVIHKTEVQRIVENADYSLSQKFFYLFYNVIFKRKWPKGFYWFDKKLSLDPLTAWFKNKQDFTVKYCDIGDQGVSFRNFYKTRRKEILYYLNVENENKFFEEMTFDFANLRGEIVWIDRHNDYLPMRLGKIDGFIESMREPAKLSTMKSMVSFLEKYRITRDGLVLRGSQHVFEKSERGNLQEDSSMYNVISLGSSASYATEYDCYVTLLREYVKVFSPEEVRIGTLTFTKANYSDEIKDIALDLCKALFGQVSDGFMDAKKGCAWLTKSIYERNILCTFVCENKSYIDKIMDLISAPTLTKYFSLFSTPIFQIGENEYDIHNYIDRLMDDDVYTICGEFREDIIIREYFNLKIQNPAKLSMDKTYKEYQKQYEDFIS